LKKDYNWRAAGRRLVWIHAEWIPKLGFLAGILNTPSAHRARRGEDSVRIGRAAAIKQPIQNSVFAMGLFDKRSAGIEEFGDGF
jgi:hypothetical protein